MRSISAGRTELYNPPINPKLKIALLWASLMSLYIYVDYFHLYMPKSLYEIMRGRVFIYDITQTTVLIGLVSVAIPAIMIFLSVFAAASINRWINLIIATVYIPYTLYNLVGRAWIHMYFAAAVEVLILLMVLGCAWAWPRVQPQDI